MSLPSSIDIAIVGAGAAGLGAARALEASGLSVLVLEARGRIGGRANTIVTAGGIPFDEGCGWLHSADRNAFARDAESLGFDLDRARPPWREQNDPAFPAEQRAEFLAALDAFYERAAEAAFDGDDAPASTCLEPGNRWNPLIDAISTYVNGAELDRVSIYDIDSYDDTNINWRVPRGYGALIAAFGASCPVALDAAVSVVDHSGPRLRLETPRGALEAAQAIITVPTNLIADEALRFSPALPHKVEAARGLPLGVNNKAMLACDRADDLPRDGSLRGVTMRTATGTYHLRPFGQPCIEAFFGGRYARDLEHAAPGAVAAAAVDEIVALLGSDWRQRLRPLAQTRWASDPFARGAYSHALPGRAGDRAILAAPIDGRLFFAGEATSPNFFSTAHGARESGERAAREVVAARKA